MRHETSEDPLAGVRSTVYLDKALHQALRLKAATVHSTISDLVNEAVRAALTEDRRDLTAFADRLSEPSITYENFLSRLKTTPASSSK